MIGMFFFYCLAGIAIGSIYYCNVMRNPLYRIENDTPFLVIICLACAPFALPIALALYLVWKFNNRKE